MSFADINTVEGLLDGVINGLKQDQPVRQVLKISFVPLGLLLDLH